MAQRSYIPDLIHIDYRGRANSIANILGNLGLVISIALFLVLNEFFGVEVAGETVITQQGYILAMSIGGIGIIIISIIGFISLKEKKGSELPPKKGFFKEFKEIFNLEELKKNKEFFKIVIAYTIFNSGVFGTMTFLFNYIFDLGFETISLIIIIGIAAPIVFLIIYLLGRFSDKYGRKKFIPITVSCASVGFILIPFLEMTAEPIFSLYVFAFTLILVAILGIIPVFDAFYQDYLPIGKKGKFIGLVNIVFTISQVIGTGVATIVSTFLGRPWIFPFMAIFFIASIPLFMKVKETISRKELGENSGK
ncbi:MAG: MFS transporter [Candidatus Lokiarchaeota archaeon]|nr:MFS transporter [Candidatus Lokiarchaeota archaeon]